MNISVAAHSGPGAQIAVLRAPAGHGAQALYSAVRSAFSQLRVQLPASFQLGYAAAGRFFSVSCLYDARYKFRSLILVAARTSSLLF